jgi:uncharacterized membrane protein YfcA
MNNIIDKNESMALLVGLFVVLVLIYTIFRQRRRLKKTNCITIGT